MKKGEEYPSLSTELVIKELVASMTYFVAVLVLFGLHIFSRFNYLKKRVVHYFSFYNVLYRESTMNCVSDDKHRQVFKLSKGVRSVNCGIGEIYK